ncbi:hypothetical protein PIB30_071214 [Stylosanthes scabra]|uniref:Uncharacterized protein n=1 Tax=Stylosanthes scabra TaxID=79078 RepID=A0ABU6XPW5_9FABA|nr:hypothetical protein [Stylosanthes scabra]
MMLDLGVMERFINYKGTLPSGQLIAIKRAQKESKQGGLEFKAEIELLSRVPQECGVLGSGILHESAGDCEERCL